MGNERVSSLPERDRLREPRILRMSAWMLRARVLIGVMPWFVAGIVILSFPILMGPAGLPFAVGWSLFLIVARSSTTDEARPRRLSVDALAAFVCLLGAYVGGWYLIPAFATFALVDLADIPSPAPHLDGRGSREILAALTTLCAGAIGVSVLILGASYSSASSSVAIDGTVTNDPIRAVGFLAVNGSNGLAVLLVATALLVAVFAGAVLHVRWGLRVGHVLTGAGAIGLVLISTLGALSVGPWLAPSAILAVVTWFAGRTEVTPAYRPSP